MVAPALDADELIQSHPVATLLIDDDAVVLFGNSAAEQLCNISRSSMVGKSLFDVVQLDDVCRQRLDDPGNPALSMRGVEIIVADNRTVIVDIQVAPSSTHAHRVIALIPVSKESEMAGSSIGRSGKSAGAAAAMLAHEIKNPLAGIKGAAQLIGRNPGRSPDRFVDLICKEVDRVATLIDQMEDFSRGQPLRCTSINPHQAIHQALAAIRAEEHLVVRLVEDFDPSIPPVLGNHDALVQILLNLLKNAGEALGSQEEAVVRIATAFRHGLSLDNGDGRGRLALPIEISVSDNGPGVSETIRDALFEPFVTTKREGRGLGLALVAKQMRDMGGAVDYSRDARWSHFRLHLPAVSAASTDGHDA